MAQLGEFLTKGGALEMIRRIRGVKAPLQKAEAALRTLSEAVGKMARRVAVNTLAIRVLDIELLERDHAVWKRIRELEQLSLGGSLDDYLRKSAVLTTEEIDGIIAAVKEKDSSLLPDGITYKYLDGAGLAYVLANIDTITPYLNVTPEDIQWISTALTAMYSVRSNRDWEVG